MKKKIIISIIITLGIVSLFCFYCISQTNEQLDDVETIILNRFNSTNDCEILITTVGGKSAAMSWNLYNYYRDHETSERKKSSHTIELTKKGNLIFKNYRQTIIIKNSDIKIIGIEEDTDSQNNKSYEILICV